MKAVKALSEYGFAGVGSKTFHTEKALDQFLGRVFQSGALHTENFEVKRAIVVAAATRYYAPHIFTWKAWKDKIASHPQEAKAFEKTLNQMIASNQDL